MNLKHQKEKFYDFISPAYKRIKILEALVSENFEKLFTVQTGNAETIKEINATVKNLQKNEERQNRKVQELLDANKKFDIEMNKVQNQIKPVVSASKYICDILNSHLKFYHNNFEIDYVKAKFPNVLNENLSEKYLKLINNLNDEDIYTVQKILNRLYLCSSSNAEYRNIFTENEKLQLSEISDKFHRSIVKLNDNLFAYKKYLLPINHFETNVFFYDCMINYFSRLDSLKNKSIIDVGGYIGDSAIVLRKYSNEKMYIFEPDPDNFQMLLKTVELNNLQNIKCENIALASGNYNVLLSQNGSMSTTNTSGDGVEVPSSTLDEYVSKNNIKVGLIKVDIEGFEEEFLNGARETITNQKPKLLISIYHHEQQFFNIKPMLESWNLGYKFQIKKPIDGNIIFETVLIGEVND